MAEAQKPTLEQCREALKKASGSVSVGLATLMLSCQLHVAQAQDKPA